MPSCLLKKLLPFALMFAAGVGLARVPHLFGLHRSKKQDCPHSAMRGRDYPAGEGQHRRGLKRPHPEMRGRFESGNFDAHGWTNILATETFPSDITAKGDSWTPVAILDRPNPVYTEAARERGVGGVVRLNVRFAADGTVSDIKTVSALPYGLTKEAVNAVSRIRFLPARRNGRAVSTTGAIDCLFHTIRNEHCLYEN